MKVIFAFFEPKREILRVKGRFSPHMYSLVLSPSSYLSVSLINVSKSLKYSKTKEKRGSSMLRIM